MADDPPTDPAALKAWYQANFQPAGSPPPPPAPPPTAAPGRPVTRPPPEFDRDSAEQRRAGLEFSRTAARKKSQRWRLVLFCFLLAATLVGAFAIYMLIQHKFGGKIPYLQSID